MCIQNRSHVSFVLADPSWSHRAGKSESEKSKVSEVGIDKQPWNFFQPLQNYAKLVGSEFFLDVSNEGRNRSYILAGWHDHTLTRNHPTTLSILLAYDCAEDRADKSQGQVELDVGDRAWSEAYWRDLSLNVLFGKSLWSLFFTDWYKDTSSRGQELPPKTIHSESLWRIFKYQWHSPQKWSDAGQLPAVHPWHFSLYPRLGAVWSKTFHNLVRAHGWTSQSWHLRMFDHKKILGSIY